MSNQCLYYWDVLWCQAPLQLSSFQDNVVNVVQTPCIRHMEGLEKAHHLQSSLMWTEKSPYRLQHAPLVRLGSEHLIYTSQTLHASLSSCVWPFPKIYKWAMPQKMYTALYEENPSARAKFSRRKSAWGFRLAFTDQTVWIAMFATLQLETALLPALLPWDRQHQSHQRSHSQLGVLAQTQPPQESALTC